MYMMAVQSGKWQEGSLPDLNTARFYHSSLGLGNQVYVACGRSTIYGDLSTVEMLRLGA